MDESEMNCHRRITLTSSVKRDGSNEALPPVATATCQASDPRGSGICSLKSFSTIRILLSRSWVLLPQARPERLNHLLYSCLHYCQSHQYGNALRYCCRAAEVTLASEHLEGLSLPLPQSLPTAPSPTRTISTIHGTRPSAAGRNFDTHTHAANPLFNLLALSLGPSIPTTVITSTATATTVIDLVSQDRGLCPPLRDYCPRGQDAAPHLALCNTDYDCAASDKCCFDACLEAHVCKTAVGDRPRRDALKEQQHHHHLKTKGAAAATLVMTADGEPVSVVVNAHGSPVSLHEGDVVTIVATSPVIASSASAPGSRSPRTQTMVQLSEKDVVFIIEDGKGNVVVDDNDNTLTLVQVGTGPTLVFNDEGIEVVLGIVSSDFSLTATVKRTKIPNLNINYKGNEYSNKGYYRVSDQRHSMGDMIMGHTARILKWKMIL
nr:uncharacterized protein LOC128691337 [Cherax quadricarinatus]